MFFPKRLFCLFLLVSIIFGINFDFAKSNQQEDYKLGSFKNHSLQKILEKPFYLFTTNKENAVLFYLKDFVNWKHQLIYNQKYLSEIETPFLIDDSTDSRNFRLELLQTYEDKLHFQKSSTIYIKKDETKEFLKSLAEDLNQQPSDGRFKMDKEKNKLLILKKSQLGTKLKIEESFDKIFQSLLENPEISYIPLAIAATNPKISTSNPGKYKIKELIGTGKSDFTGSSKTRIYNIKNASKRFNGIILKPQEEFSFTTTLGEVDESTGYKEELVIKKNKTIPEFGGGICQLSTTMFRAALNSGMKITERHNHSYPVHYYDPPGTDATVYVPRPDLKFENITNDYILIQTRIDEPEKKFYIDFYSRKDLYNVELLGPKITERTSEGKIRTILTQVVKNKKTGKEIFQDVFKSFYDNPDNYPNPNEIFLEKPQDWSNRQWEEYYAKFGAVIEELKKEN